MSIMSTSVSGMLANSNWLSTISQNVANANTPATRTSRRTFRASSTRSRAAPLTSAASRRARRSLNALQGNVVGTSTPTDSAVQGAGFFVVSDASGALYLTRNGSFVPDASAISSMPPATI